MLSPKPLLFLLLLIFFTFFISQSSGNLSLVFLFIYIGYSNSHNVFIIWLVFGYIIGTSERVVNDVHRNFERVVLETPSSDDNSSLILADKRTRRKDPIDEFKYYSGGWNISDEHYISVSFLIQLLILIQL